MDTTPSSGATTLPLDEALPILQLLGERATILHPPRVGRGAIGGGDLDCAVSNLDAMWPLRLPEGWVLCQRLHYDATGWYWVLDRHGSVLAVDTLEDPHGIGRLCFPSTLAFGDGPELLAPATARAAYLTAKRLDKGSRAEPQWRHIGRLAQQDRRHYRMALSEMLGPDVSEDVATYAEQGIPPPPAVWRRARRAQIVRRVQTPTRALELLARSSGRIVERVLRPTGMSVLIVGPDGSGKSTLAEELPKVCRGLFRRALRIHWRPGLLPRPRSLVGRGVAGGPPDPSQPHARPPHGRVVSLALLGYYWIDWVVGGWTRLRVVQIRTGLVMIERGWWDVAVDPGRYRLTVPPVAVNVLGRFLPRPDLAIVLDVPSGVASERKGELAPAEVERQTRAWGTALPRTIHSVHLDASGPAEKTADAARDEIVQALSARAHRRLGAGWLPLPHRSNPRWLFPRGPRSAVHDSLLLYQPVTVRARIGWEMARVVGSIGGFRLLPRGGPPAPQLRRSLAPHLPRHGSLAMARANHPGRSVALVRAPGAPPKLIKLASDERGRQALSREARALETLARDLPPPLSAPALLHHEPGMLVERAIRWHPRARPWLMPKEVAFALGTFFWRGARRREGVLEGPAHGDCAPWNLLRSNDAWVLVDWEDAREEAPPFFDLLHFLVQSHSLLGRPSTRAIVEGVHGRASIGELVHAYAAGARLDGKEAAPLLIAYLEERGLRLRSEQSASERAAARARARLLAALQR
jgi:hypothetical protein